MGEYVDILIYALVAVLVLGRLWTLLGRRREDESQRPNPFAAPPEAPPPPPTTQSPAPGEDSAEAIGASHAALDSAVPNKALTYEVAPTSLAGVLLQIKAVDATFAEKPFLAGAKAAFGLIVDSFAKGDHERLERLVAPDVFARFKQALEDRLAAQQTQESRIERLTDASLTAARLDGTRAFLTVDFTSHQVNVTRDAEGRVVAGDPDHPEEVRDVWVFARDLASHDPNWQLVETRS